MSASRTDSPWYLAPNGLIKSLGVPGVRSLDSYYASIGSVTQRDPHPMVDGRITTDTQRANGEFIVRACNVHDELVAALEHAADVLHGAARICGACNFGDGSTGKGEDGYDCVFCAPVREAEQSARTSLAKAEVRS